MNVYQKRFRNAVDRAKKINSLIQSGYLVFIGDKIIPNLFEITDRDIRLWIGGRSWVVIFINDPEYDNGIHTTIKKFNDTVLGPVRVFSLEGLL